MWSRSRRKLWRLDRATDLELTSGHAGAPPYPTEGLDRAPAFVDPTLRKLAKDGAPSLLEPKGWGEPPFGILARMRIVALVAGMLAIGLAAAPGREQAPETPLRVSLCEVKAHPENYVRKLVEFTATASHGFENSMVEDSRCKWPNAGPGVWMEYGGKRSTGTMYCCGVSPKPVRSDPLIVDGMRLDLVDDDTFREFDKRLHPAHSKQQSDTVRATLRGRIFARYEGIMGTHQDPMWGGYGHMGCCMLFVVTQVVSVDPPRP